MEESSGRIQSLQESAGQNAGRDILILQGNANLEIPKVCNRMGTAGRAVVFSDPYTTEVSWDTVKAVAGTRRIDCWILFRSWQRLSPCCGTFPAVC